jgi:exodeoxyribonuclease-3
MIKVATLNVNGVNGRLPVLLRWLQQAKSSASRSYPATSTSSPRNLDVYKPERWLDDALFRTEVWREFHALMKKGRTDAVRATHPGEVGLHLLGLFPERLWAERRPGHRPPAAQPEVLPRLVKAGVDRDVCGWERASDHAPTWIALRPVRHA